MSETTTMLANIIKLIIDNMPYIYSPQLSIEDNIKELINKNKKKEFIGYDEYGDEQYKISVPLNKELDEALNLLLIVVEKDRSEIRRFMEGKVEVLEDKVKTVRKIVNKYSDIEEDN